MTKIKHKKKVFLISNMYPSKENVRYGIFVKNFEEAIKYDYRVKKIVLTRKTNIFYKLIGYLILYLKILKLIFKAEKEDIIYVHFPLHVAPVLTILLRFNKKIVLNFHGSDLLFKSSLTKFLSCFLKSIIKHTLVVVPSNYYKEKITSEFGVLPSKILVYPSGGVNRSLFFPKDKQTRKNFVIGYVSNFIPEKGWKLLLEGVKIINKKIKDFEVIMIGDGPDKGRVEEMVLTLEVKVTIFSNLKQNKLAEKYNEFDLFVFPTYRESLGLVGIEAMACGVPVVSGKAGGPMGYIENGYNGYLFEKEDTQDLVRQILCFYNLSTLEKNQMSKNCGKTAILYDSIKVKEKLIAFLKQIK